MLSSLRGTGASVVTEGLRPPRRTWLLLLAAAVVTGCSLVLRSRTDEVTWYELGLMLLGCVLVIFAGLLLAPIVIRRLRPSTYEHKSTTGERMVLAVLWVVLGAVVVTISTGPAWVPLLLMVVAVAGVALLNRRQRLRIHGR
jgi:purine-cytosine permease-like protein